MSRKIGLLTPTQPQNTPYSQAHRYVAKAVAATLIRRALVDIILRDNAGAVILVRERKAHSSPSIVERQYVPRLPIKHVHKLNPPGPPQSLDLSYPEPLRTTVIHPHHAMREACRAAKQRKAKQRKEEAARLAAQM